MSDKLPDSRESLVEESLNTAGLPVSSTRLTEPVKPAHLRRWKEAVELLAPAYFAMVMGTGIISIGLFLTGWTLFSQITLWIAAAGYVVLWALYIARFLCYRERFMGDLKDPRVAFTFFTMVAGTNVLAVRFFYEGIPTPGTILGILGITLWFVLGYVLPWKVFMTRDGQPILARANGSWFVWSVASHSQAIALSLMQHHVAPNGVLYDALGLLAVLTWSVGITLYAGIAVLVLLRVILYGLSAKEFEPSYWVAMGALAIAVVAGTTIITLNSTPMIEATKRLIASTAVIFWCFCIWLYPMLVGIGMWRHFIHKVPFRYTPVYWTLVFPLGMIGVASISLGKADALPLVGHLGNVFLGIATIVWVLVILGLLKRIGEITVNTLRT